MPILLAFFLLTGCTTEPPEASEEPSTAAAETLPTTTAAETDPAVLQKVAERLAGLDDAEGAEPWATHARAMDTLWQRIEERHLDPMATWSSTALADLEQPELPLFYPFGGPDLPSVHQFFPRAGSYVLVGLEPPGLMPTIDSAGNTALDAELDRLREGFDNLAEKGYFVAKHMEDDFTATHLTGFMPVLHIALARSGYRPTAVRFFALDDEGTPRYLESITPETARAVEITFVDSDATEGDDTEPRHLYYFAQDLSNSGLRATPGFLRFVDGLGPFNVYMKAAMYLPHEPEFHDLNAFMLERAQNILEEDSGIPLRAFDGHPFDLTYFGAYEATLPAYREYFQEDLRDAYAAAKPAPLPFAIGYNSRIAGSCLILAERTGEAMQQPGEPR